MSENPYDTPKDYDTPADEWCGQKGHIHSGPLCYGKPAPFKIWRTGHGH